MVFLVNTALVTTVWGLYLSFGGSFVLALYSLRLRVRKEKVELTCIDAQAYLSTIYGLWAIGLVLALLFPSTKQVFFELIGAALFVFGLRLKVRVEQGRTVVVRRVLFLFPWNRKVYPHSPRARVDGWGDAGDPEAISLDFDGASSTIELAWSNSRSGDRAEKIATAFNIAVQNVSV